MADLITELTDADIRTQWSAPRSEERPGGADGGDDDAGDGGADGGADDADGTDSGDDADTTDA